MTEKILRNCFLEYFFLSCGTALGKRGGRGEKLLGASGKRNEMRGNESKRRELTPCVIFFFDRAISRREGGEKRAKEMLIDRRKPGDNISLPIFVVSGGGIFFEIRNLAHGPIVKSSFGRNSVREIVLHFNVMCEGGFFKLIGGLGFRRKSRS